MSEFVVKGACATLPMLQTHYVCINRLQHGSDQTRMGMTLTV